MKKYTLFLFLLICICKSVRIAAQTGRYYSTEQGLSSSLINHIYQDKHGYIWMATEYGLSRFDGRRFVNYKQTSGVDTDIKNNYVRTIYETKKNVLLIGCIDGLMKYDRETDTYREIPMIRSDKQVFPHVTQIVELNNNEVWISTSGQGMFCLDDNSSVAKSLDHKLYHGNYNFQSCFYEDSFGSVWIGTEGNGLIRYAPSTGQISTYKYPEIIDNNISSIIEDSGGNLFIGTQKQGLSRYDSKNNRFETIYHRNGNKISVYCLSFIEGKLIIGTDGQGLMYYNPSANVVDNYTINDAPFDFSDGKVHAILEDRDKNLWIGLFQKGIILLPKTENDFRYMGSKSVHYNPIGQRCIMSVYRTEDNHLWVGADSEGVFELDESGKRLNHYALRNASYPVGNTVMSIFEDSQNNLWLGSYMQGLLLLDRKNGKFEQPLKIASEKVMSITEDHSGNLYIATLGAGFYQYNLHTKNLIHFESSKDEKDDFNRNELANDWVNTLYCDKEGLIWIGHYKGVSCFNPKTSSFLDINNINTLISYCVGYSLVEDRDGNIWAGTTDGLFKLNKNTGESINYDTTNGLPNNVICGICEDTDGNLWMSTYKGISKYSKVQDRFINYYAGDGLQGNEFTHGSYHRDVQGILYFGGINGITSFMPEKIKGSPKKTEVLITEFYLFTDPINRTTQSGGKPVIYTSVQQSNIFQLHHNDNTFSIVFSTLQYSNTEQMSYQYKIDELSQQWLNTDPGVNRVTYNNLPPGRYTFHVRSFNLGEYSEARTISIIITPPWYLTWWAYWIYFFMFLLLIYIVIKIILTRINHRRELMKRDHAEELNEAKLQFFINISHEIRTPMTLIINPLEKLLNTTKDAELKKTYLMIYRNSQRILRLINQLMDIRKIDKGQMHMKFRQTDMVGFICDVMTTFEYAAQLKGIEMKFNNTLPQLMVYVDLNNFDKVLMNTLSNALKYTESGGMVMVDLSVGQDLNRNDALRDYFEISITDTGIGIDEAKIERIFERFYQVDNDKTKSNFGTGIGLHLSRSLVELHHGIIYAENRKDGQGCRIVVRIPLGNSHLRPDEYERNIEITPDARHNLIGYNEVFEDINQESAVEKNIRAKSKFRILVAEDEPEIQNYLKSELSDEYRIILSSNGKDAYDKILTDTPDLVISDVMMPEMDGFTLCRKIKQNTNVNHLPVILLTARSASDDKLEGIDMGADAYLVKPFNTELLKGTINNLISNRKLLRNKFSGAQQQEDKIDSISLKSSDDILMDKVMRVVNEHIANPEFNVEMLASEVGMSRVHIYRKLKELTNLSARDFIKNIRLQQAANLLKTDKKLTISDVAYATGHINLSHFSNSFKNKYGMSPTEYSAAFRE